MLANPSFAKEGDGKPGREGATPVVTQLLGHEGCATSKVQPMPLHAHERNAFRVATGAAAGIGGTPAVFAALSVPAVQEALGQGSGVRGVGCHSHP